ncbi:hypothetical protein SERLA73DRAFT_181951 [Serpula lacrymans var. lacrymans S7.3]|uniref:Uncharacterized protein n=1 Tax=Serpula lacrymans var. lacrymans (strain S7.3) TaxID=936435 RepID=F8PZ22_SERL3|nr:hypothetical protein SERLA73DRAFT_181951 [Serpula lacrymans var. lacrymans S7.3]
MPGDLWEVSRNGMHKTITLRRTIRAADWAIFDKYASRVRTLILWNPVLELYDSTLLSIFARTVVVWLRLECRRRHRISFNDRQFR